MSQHIVAERDSRLIGVDPGVASVEISQEQLDADEVGDEHVDRQMQDVLIR